MRVDLGWFASGCIPFGYVEPCAVQRSGQDGPWNVTNIATMPVVIRGSSMLRV
jgi:hypothetical protein